MAIRLRRKVLIIPVGFYQLRVLKSIVRSGAETFYLISDSKPEYQITKSIAENLAKQIHAFVVDLKVEMRDVDFLNPEDIYRVFTEIIERERKKDPDTTIILDITSTTKVATLAAINLANFYDLVVSHVPGKKKLSKEVVEERYKLEKNDEGGEYKELFVPQPITEGKRFDSEETKILNVLGENQFDSIIELIIGLAKKENIISIGHAYKKRITRTVHGLEAKGLIVTKEEEGIGRGRAQAIRLTEMGKGITKGILESRKNL